MRRQALHPRRIIGGIGGLLPPGPVSTFVPPPPFSPLDIAGLVFWQDPSDATSFTESAGIVTARTNKVSLDSVSPAAGPGYSATLINGFPGFDYNGTTQQIITAEAAVNAALVNAHAYTLIGVWAAQTVDRNDAFFGTGNSGIAGNNTRSWGQSSSATGRHRSVTQNDVGTVVTVIGTKQSDANAHVFCFHSPGTTVSWEIDQVADVTGAAQDPGTLTSNRVANGSRPDSVPDTFADALEGEVLLYDSELSAGDITTLCNYMKAKWGTP